MKNKRFLLWGLLVLYLPCFCFGGEKENAVSFVVSYLNDMGENILEKGNVFQKYYHPDYIILGGEKLDFTIIGRKFKVLKVSETSNSHNFNHPQKGKFFAVKIKFEQVGQFDGFNVNLDKGSYVETFYCLRSKGKYLIVQNTDPEVMLCFYDSAIKWLEKKSKTEKNYKNAVDVLKSVKR